MSLYHCLSPLALWDIEAELVNSAVGAVSPPVEWG